MTITCIALWFGFNIAVLVLRLRAAGYFRAARRTPVDIVQPVLKLVFKAVGREFANHKSVIRTGGA